MTKYGIAAFVGIVLLVAAFIHDVNLDRSMIVSFPVPNSEGKIEVVCDRWGISHNSSLRDFALDLVTALDKTPRVRLKENYKIMFIVSKKDPQSSGGRTLVLLRSPNSILTPICLSNLSKLDRLDKPTRSSMVEKTAKIIQQKIALAEKRGRISI